MTEEGLKEWKINKKVEAYEEYAQNPLSINSWDQYRAKLKAIDEIKP